MRRYPHWLTKPFTSGGTASMVRELVDDLELETVCQSALCPNLAECYSHRQLTFMILGKQCTRACRFCAVSFGKPEPVRVDEPARVAEAIHRLGLRHAVITSVARDDLAEEGAAHFVAVIEAIRQRNPGVTLEVLVPDFHGRPELIKLIMDSQPEIFAHNIETIERLSPILRPLANYARSLAVLRMARALSAGSLIKSSLMLGLGERWDEVAATLQALLEAGCTHVTVGQYLRPTPMDLPVMEYLSPQRFEAYARLAYRQGFQWVQAGPFVRSSYHASDALHPAASCEAVGTEPVA